MKLTESGEIQFESKQERRHLHAVRAGQSGRIKMTATQVLDCVKHLESEWVKANAH
jgi:hypothetical protein